ncbi:hypothetical protein PCANC_20194 [Puccinia coronata f. sp. avenae]|uniref:DNA primase n=1 Tax=Puccinia coronata f. sp. avenae TaxID=200324 RepID=A0A2N5STY6_9BASI|nr:hypothetical protein PCASD_18478 [Puccinia coronata f. sp. avenae]PLW34424.1 hypothetical protein PCANC_20194 [Puccinia coronata f. sp. avenae]
MSSEDQMNIEAAPPVPNETDNNNSKPLPSEEIQPTAEVPNKDDPSADELKDVPLDQLFDDEMDVDVDVDVDDAGPLNAEEYRLLAQFDDPWADLKDPHVMMNFYRRIFPWKQLFLWLNHDHVPNYLFTHREFAITLQNDAYLRYNSYSSYIELQKDIIRLNPTRFEIGPTYSAAPKDRKTIPKASFKPILRELVFDIDLTDYDDIRRCCSDKKICTQCWKFVALAVEVLDLTLRHDFGYQHLLWVYSGRRGAHCWVSDEEAMRLTDDQRKAIVNYINIFKAGGSKFGLKVDLKNPLHPMVERSLEKLQVHFLNVVLQGQEVFMDEEKWTFLLRIWSDTNLVQAFEEEWKKNPEISSESKWKAILQHYKPENNKTSNNIPSKKMNGILETINNVILHYSYPRIDLEVSKHLNHLLKSPFCVHPATGKVCIPIDPTTIASFDPNSAPDVRDLLRQLDKQQSSSNPLSTAAATAATTAVSAAVTTAAAAASAASAAATTTTSASATTATTTTATTTATDTNATAPQLNWANTSLRPYVEFFQRHVDKLLKDTLQSKKNVQSDSLEF